VSGDKKVTGKTGTFYNANFHFDNFSGMFNGPFNCGLFQKAVDKGVVKVDVRNIRDYTHDKHHTTDDAPYGGAAGMVMKPEPISKR